MHIPHVLAMIFDAMHIRGSEWWYDAKGTTDSQKVMHDTYWELLATARESRRFAGSRPVPACGQGVMPGGLESDEFVGLTTVDDEIRHDSDSLSAPDLSFRPDS